MLLVALKNIYLSPALLSAPDVHKHCLSTINNLTIKRDLAVFAEPPRQLDRCIGRMLRQRMADLIACNCFAKRVQRAGIGISLSTMPGSKPTRNR
jgi:hypothetical protein